MARRNKDNEGDTAVLDAPEGTEAEVTEAQAPEAVEGAVEATVEAEGAETAPEAEGQAAEPAEADLTPFIEVTEAVVAERDESTGALPEGGLDRVLAAFRELPDVKARNRAKKHLNGQMAQGMEDMDLSLAKAYLTLHDNMTTSTASKDKPKAPVDPTAAWKQKLQVVTLAYGELSRNTPEGVTPETVTEVANETAALAEQMDTYRVWLETEPAEGEDKPEAPEVDNRVVQAFRVINTNKGVGRGGGPRTPHDGPRRDVAKHIQSAFADQESGAFLSIAQIKAHKSEEYGDDSPSAGAISARLFPTKGQCTVEGVTPGTGGEKDTRGAYKA